MLKISSFVDTEMASKYPNIIDMLIYLVWNMPILHIHDLQKRTMPVFILATGLVIIYKQEDLGSRMVRC